MQTPHSSTLSSDYTKEQVVWSVWAFNIWRCQELGRNEENWFSRTGHSALNDVSGSDSWHGRREDLQMNSKQFHTLRYQRLLIVFFFFPSLLKRNAFNFPPGTLITVLKVVHPCLLLLQQTLGASVRKIPAVSLMTGQYLWGATNLF